MVKQKSAAGSSTLAWLIGEADCPRPNKPAPSGAPLIWFNRPSSQRDYEIVEANVVDRVADEDSPVGYALESRGREPVLIETGAREAKRPVSLQPHFLDEDFGLYFEFGDWLTRRDSVLTFARRYGRLGGACEVPIVYGGRESIGEPVSRWFAEIRAMDRAIRIRQLIGAANPSRIQGFIRVEVLRRRNVPGAAIRVVAPHDAEPLFDPFAFDASLGEEGTHLGPFDEPSITPAPETEIEKPTGDQVLDAARMWLGSEINTRISGAVTTMVSEDPLDGVGGLRLVPQNLLAGLWLQLGMAVSGYRKYRTCKKCGKPIELSSRGARNNRRYCGPGCKSDAAADRQREAIELHEQRIEDEREIAVRVGSKPETVRKWLRDHNADKRRREP